MKFILSFATLLFLFTSVIARDSPYDLRKLDSSKRKNLDAYFHFDDLELNVRSASNVVIRKKYAVTIYNKRQLRYAFLEIPTSPMVELRKVKFCLFDSLGKEIDNIPLADFGKSNSQTIAGYYDDWMIRYAAFRKVPIPCTVEVSYELQSNQSFVLPGYSNKLPTNVASGPVSVTLNLPAEMDFNVQTKGGFVQSTALDKEGRQSKWSLAQIAARTMKDTTDIDEREGVLEVSIALRNFELNKVPGSYASWDSLGRFVYRLNANRDQLLQDTKDEVTKMCAGKTENEKIRLLYQYLQENTRYVSIQYGIGGWQTLDAAFVCQKKYGDCKALTNFMMSLLKSAGITAHPVLVAAGEKPDTLDREFVSDVFNHVILMIPRNTDTVWLECTSKRLPANYLGKFTAGRTGLIFKEGVCGLVETPYYDTAYNATFSKTVAILNDDNSATLQTSNVFHGAEGFEYRSALTGKNALDVNELMTQRLQFKAFRIIEEQHEERYEGMEYQFQQTLKMQVNALVSKAGSVKFFDGNLLPRRISVDYSIDERKEPFILNESRSFTDTFIVKAPEGYKVSVLPQSISLNHPFGYLIFSATRVGNDVQMVRKLAIVAGKYPPTLYKSYQTLAKTLISDNNYHIIFKADG